jgi:adenylate cyclase
MHLAELNRASFEKYVRSVGVRQIRLACGLVLFAYLLSHFVNHALGNISLDALATGVRYHTAFWKSLPISTVFYAAAATMPASGSMRFTSAVNFTGKRSSRYNLY